MSERIRCPRCGGQELDYVESVTITVDFHAIYRNEHGKLQEADLEYDREYFDLPDEMAETYHYRQGMVVCSVGRCEAAWPSLEALQAEVDPALERRRQAAEQIEATVTAHLT